MTEEQRTSLLNLASRSGIVRVKNVMNPLLWLVGIALPTLLIFCLTAGQGSVVGTISAFVGFSLVIFAIAVYVYFIITNPDRLQSEEYNLKAMEMRLISKKRGEIRDPVELQPVAIEVDEQEGEQQ